MSISLRCCGKDHKLRVKKCVICGSNLVKYVIRVKDQQTNRWCTKTVNSYKLAKEIENKFKTAKIENNLFDKKKIGTFSFVNYLTYAKLHKKTWHDDQLRWNKHVEGQNFHTKQGILQILKQMDDSGYKPATVHHVLRLIRRVYNWHIQNSLFFQDNPCNNIKLKKYDNRVNNILSKPETVNLISYLNDWENRRSALVILFGIYTGRRKGEILELRWDNVNFEQNSITCINTKNGSNQSFPLNRSALSVLIESKEISISQYVFPSSTGNFYYNGFNLAWSRLKKRIGLTIRFHDLRHNFASHLASSKRVDIYTLKKLLGHKDINLTLRYAHLLDNVVKNANDVIDDMFQI